MTPFAQPQSSEPAGTIARVIDISSFARRQKYLLIVPALLQIGFALIVIYSTLVFARLSAIGAAIWFSEGSWTPALWGALAAPISFLAASIVLLNYRAFAHSSTWSFAAATLLILGWINGVAFLQDKQVDLAETSMVAAGIAGAYLIQTTVARLVFDDPGGWVLWRGPPCVTPVATLHRYGGLNRFRIVSSVLKLILWLSGPAFVVLLLSGAQFLFSRVARLDGWGFLSTLLSSLAVMFVARPFFANQLWRAIRTFKVENAEAAAAVYQSDKRPRILLLRSFYDDSVEIPYARSRSEVVFGLKLQRVRLEEAIVDIAYRYGPVGALQDPNASLKPLGAARDLATNQDWQGHIKDALHDASIVIMILGLTPGLRWELRTIRELGFLNKTIFIFPPADRADVGVIRETLRELFPSGETLWNEKDRRPLLMFSDATGQWHVAISPTQAEQDYQNALLLAIEFGDHATTPVRRRVQTANERKPPQRLLNPTPEKPDDMRWLPWAGTAVAALFFSWILFNESPSPPHTDPGPTISDVERPDSNSKASIEEEQPPIGTNQVFGPAQLRYCLAQIIRLEAARKSLDMTDDNRVDRYNKAIDEYNDHCDGSPSDQRTLKAVQEDLDRHRLELEAEGRSRF